MNVKQTQQIIIDELKQCAIDLGHVPTRNEFYHNWPARTVSKYSVDCCFGGITIALKAAGLIEKGRNESQVKRTAIEARCEEIDRLKSIFIAEIDPFANKFHIPRKDDRSKKLIAAGDFHFEYYDPFCVEVFIDACYRLQPHHIVLAGDIVDFYAISSFSKDPRRLLTLQNEIDLMKEKLFKPLRQYCPNSNIDYIIGNHEARLIKYLASQSPALSSLNCLQLDKLLELDKYQINLIAKKSLIFDGGKDNHKIYFDDLIVTHGFNCGSQHAITELAKWGNSGISGHVHHEQIQMKVDMNKIKKWVSMGCMCLKDAEFISDINRWTQGFCIATNNDGSTYLETVSFSEKGALAAGVFYKRLGI